MSKLSEAVKNLVETIAGGEAVETATEWAMYCPFHPNFDTPAFYINKTTGLWHCFNESCAQKGNFFQLCDRLNLTDLAGPHDIDIDINKLLLADEEEREPSWLDALDRITIDYNKESEKLRYLVERGFDLAILEHFEVGFSDKQSRIVIPARDENYKIVGFIGRAINEEIKPKYKYSSGFPRANILFNLQNAKQYSEVIITEGSLDAIKVHQAGFPNVISTLGSNINDGQVNLLGHYFNGIVLLSDNDPAGESLKRAIIDRCARMNISVVRYPEGVKDPGELNEKQIRELIANRINYLDALFNDIYEKEKK